jgi:hypothetical protein
MSSAGKIGALTACSYLGLLIGPPTFGGLSVLLQQLRWALFVDAFLMFMIAPLARVVFQDTGQPRLLNVSISRIFDGVQVNDEDRVNDDRALSVDGREGGVIASGRSIAPVVPDHRAFAVETDRLVPNK